MQELVNVIQRGWPENKHAVPPSLREYCQYRDELCTQDGLVFKGFKVIIPQIMWREVIWKLHGSHQAQMQLSEKHRTLSIGHILGRILRKPVNAVKCAQHTWPSRAKSP